MAEHQGGDQLAAAGRGAVVAAEGAALGGWAVAGRGAGEVGGLDAGDADALARSAPERAVAVVDAGDLACEDGCHSGQQ